MSDVLPSARLLVQCVYLIYFSSCSLFAAAGNYDFKAYLKSYALVQDGIEIENYPAELDKTTVQSQNSLRLMAGYFADNGGSFEIHYELQPIYYSAPALLAFSGGNSSTLTVGSNPYRYSGPDPILKEYGDKVVVLQNLDRLNYRYSNELGDLTVGRQVVSFGSARFVNPTDIFVPFSIQTLNQEYRVGIDALRFQADMGAFAVLDVGLIIGEDGKSENRAAFIRGKKSLQGNDIEALLIHTDAAWLVGGGIERALADLGFWFETAYAIVDKGDNYWRSSTGLDYSFSENIISMIEYHHNGAGSGEPDDYADLLSQQPYKKGGVYLLGEHYLIPALSWVMTPLINFTASGFFNLSDSSVFLNVAVDVSWSDNLYSDFGSFITAGDGFTYLPEQQELNFGSEFGGYPFSLYASLKYYF